MEDHGDIWAEGDKKNCRICALQRYAGEGRGRGRGNEGGLDDVVRNGDWRERDRIVIMDRKYCRCGAEESDNINESKTKASDKELGAAREKSRARRSARRWGGNVKGAH